MVTCAVPTAVRLVFDVPVDDAQAMQVSDSQKRLAEAAAPTVAPQKDRGDPQYPSTMAFNPQTAQNLEWIMSHFRKAPNLAWHEWPSHKIRKHFCYSTTIHPAMYWCLIWI